MDFFSLPVIEDAIVQGTNWLGGTPLSLAKQLILFVPFAIDWLYNLRKPKKKNKSIPKWHKYYGFFLGALFVGYWGFAWGYSYKNYQIETIKPPLPPSPVSVWFKDRDPEIDLSPTDNPPTIKLKFYMEASNDTKEARIFKLSYTLNALSPVTWKLGVPSMEPVGPVDATITPSEIKVQASDILVFYLDIPIITTDQHLPEFYKELKVLSKTLGVDVILVSDRKERAETKEIVVFRDSIIKKYKDFQTDLFNSWSQPQTTK
jgi:hypothetical protein